MAKGLIKIGDEKCLEQFLAPYLKNGFHHPDRQTRQNLEEIGKAGAKALWEKKQYQTACQILEKIFDPDKKDHNQLVRTLERQLEVAERENRIDETAERKAKACLERIRERKNDIPEKINDIRIKLYSLGFVDRPLQELTERAQHSHEARSRAAADWELALWNMHEKSDDCYRKALGWITRARSDATDQDFCSRLDTAELLCHYFLNQPDKGRKTFERASREKEIEPDVMLAWTNYQVTPVERIQCINKALVHYDIPPVSLLPDEGQLTFDRLTCTVKLPDISHGPKVTVLIAAYDAARRLPTALRSLQAQTWKNLEIIVIDDCSPTNGTVQVTETFAAKDPRIRVIRMEKNGGLYLARNRGLHESTGEFITSHDADDWSHPLKIETQVRYLLANSQVMGCTSEHTRATSDLSYIRWTGTGHLIVSDSSSFMFRQSSMKEHFGYWDSVRSGADNELIRRFSTRFGKTAVVHMPTGPLSFRRYSPNAMIEDEGTDMYGFYFGAAKIYFQAYSAYHRLNENLYYPRKNVVRPFAVPEPLLTGNNHTNHMHFDIIIASEFRMSGGSVESCIEEIRATRAYGMRVGIVELHRYDLVYKAQTGIRPEVWREIDGTHVSIIAYGQKATCDLLLLRYPPVLQELQRYIPKINAKRIKVIVNQPPMSDYGTQGIIRYTLKKCAENIKYYFGKEAIWHPIGPQVRKALHTHHGNELYHINLSAEDWYNIIDINEWYRRIKPRSPKDKLRIGRHSRDHAHKWPQSKADILAAYPDSDDTEVHVLGGTSTAKKILGSLPDNWIEYPFGSLHPRDFLQEIDVWIYFANPDWIESFGRAVIEAMAAGIPVILPEIYRPLFNDAAIYATPQTALKIAQELHADPDAYTEQAEKARKYVAERFSHEMHMKRIKSFL
ncbi:glycosyltransferase [Prosthecochloris sp. HL-130-GSB]|uniref:glycosyltransferase n=1 Tax=Prosthecochloris sp. HL-130-GSB TaxID=1974213 RepID=UPI0018DD9DF9|nr:glycosyltransferase [Prosthecochloris sp. HL-130-GSB]